MNDPRFIQNLHDLKPYFGSEKVSMQGALERHKSLLALVRMLSKEKNSPIIKILEIGSWAGGSALTWAEGLKRYNRDKGRILCVDPWRPYIDTDANPSQIYQTMTDGLNEGLIYQLFQHNVESSGFGDLISSCRGTSKDILPLFQDASFDIVYIDGDHVFEQVGEDIQLAKRLVREGGILCGDDLELQMDECDVEFATNQAKEKVDYVEDKKTGINFHPGVTLATWDEFGRVSAWNGFWAIRKTGDSWETFDLDHEKIELPQHLADAIEETNRTTPMAKICGEMENYNLVHLGDRYIGIHQKIGLIDLFDEPVGLRELSPIIFVANSMEDLQNKIAKNGILSLEVNRELLSGIINKLPLSEALSQFCKEIIKKLLRKAGR
jgi:predicted O-methyltransferase YrrM